MYTEELMFSLLRSELTKAELDAGIYQNLPCETYRELYALSRKHDISHIIASALSRMRVLGKDETANNFNKSFMMAMYRDGQKQYALDQLSTIFENADRELKFLVGPTTERPGPTLLIDVVTALNAASKSITPSIEIRSVDIANNTKSMKIYIAVVRTIPSSTEWESIKIGSTFLG